MALISYPRVTIYQITSQTSDAHTSKYHSLRASLTFNYGTNINQ